ncbi:hypothetical protein [Mucilaginibacter lappiensis]|uniref:Uncharacterized protein n=1 Tax=Mucilaginibacter lappiensis TaxID=354630 RepID=A0A841JE55_9SPHI|nr:hypothetical protein [Mucilaginibacter lappiensis]MBB6126371.1 hypothetical protein [Mucilaginibacter lappiensis]
MKQNKFKKYLLGSLAGGLLIYIGYFFYSSTVELSENKMVVEQKSPVNYTNLFDAEAKKKIVLQSAVSFKHRNSVAYYIYDKKYGLEVTQINIKQNLLFRKDLAETHTTEGYSFPDAKLPFNEGGFTTNYNVISKDAASKIYLSLRGDSIHTLLKNDSVAYYFLKLQQVYISYVPKGVYDIYIQANTKFYFFSKKQPVSLMFLKRNDALYFLLLTVNDADEKLPPNLLYDLTNK